MAGVAGSKWLREEDALAAIESLADRFRVGGFTFAGSSTEVRVTCLEHELSYRQTVKKLVAGTVACPRCRGRFGGSADLRSYLEDRYGEGYDFSTVDYRGLAKPVAFSCRTHGELTVTPQRLMRGQACRTCEHGIGMGDFIRRADELYGVGFYDYSEVSYRVGTDWVTVGCPIHGDFRQTVVELLRGHGCQKCGRDWGMGFEGFLESSSNPRGSLRL